MSARLADEPFYVFRKLLRFRDKLHPIVHAAHEHLFASTKDLDKSACVISTIRCESTGSVG
ncbi:hypothetical protein CJU94_33215 (plasmid) [Paraburkholderia aromaticivorans]|uniref:Uncharacterized protein n=1 Tax=Paraburkholderia aromaticivorans TaxID=2026199 RepID=A0A248VVT6_9BURK|nr:hypothetical protein CJU94_33215 [Paraburkholderia aromaticivorans]